MKQNKIKIGAQFSGVGAFDQALRRLNINYENIYQADWDKYARKTYLHNYEQPEYYVEDVYDTPMQEITDKHGSLDLMMFSPPCQAFSLAGNRKGEQDKRGVLFYNSHEFIKINKPRFFIFENVKGLISDDSGKTFQRWIDMLGGKSVNGNPVIFPHDDATPYHVYHKVLNAKNYGVPQNRERIFIIGIRDDQDNNFNFPKEIPLTKRLRDVLEYEVNEKYYLSDKMINFFVRHTEKHQAKGNGFKFKPKESDSIAQAVTTKSGTRPDDNYLKVKSATLKGYEIAEINEDSINLEYPNSETRKGRMGKKVAQTLTTSCNYGVVMIESVKENQTFLKNKLKLFLDKNGYIPELYNPYNNNELSDVSPTLTTCADRTTNSSSVIYNKDYRIRKLTPRECFRLMDFPDNFDFSVVSDSQAYKQAGNSIVVNVLAQIINKLNLKST